MDAGFLRGRKRCREAVPALSDEATVRQAAEEFRRMAPRDLLDPPPPEHPPVARGDEGPSRRWLSH